MGFLIGFNAVSIGTLVFHAVRKIIGNNPLGRLTQIIAVPVCSLLYIALMSWANMNAPFVLATIIMLGPVGISILAVILWYIFIGPQKRAVTDKK